MDKSQFENFKNMSKEERTAFIKAHQDELADISLKDLESVNGGYYLYSDANSDWCMNYTSEYVIPCR